MSIGRSNLDHDPVNAPSHYTFGGIECIDAIEAMLGPIGASAFRKGNAVKYIWRAGHKGPYVEDLEKARWYLDREIQKCTITSDEDVEGEPERGDEPEVPADRISLFFIEDDGSLTPLPNVLNVRFSGDTHPSIHGWCGVDEDASVGSPHEAPTDRPHRPVDHDRSGLARLGRMAREQLRRE
jgi:hypothetical protein